MTTTPSNPVSPPAKPVIRTVTVDDVQKALKAGLADFKKAPAYGLFFGGFYAVGGILIFLCLAVFDIRWMIFPIAIGFPLAGPFAAAGLYEISRRLQTGESLDLRQILGVMVRQQQREFGWMAFTTLFIFWIWMYQVRLLLAVFLGSKSFSSASSFVTVITTTPEGWQFLFVGSLIGLVLALVLFSVSVVSMPLLLDREVDFVTAMITSISTVAQNPKPMITWGILITALTIAAMLPFFLGLLIVFPVLGHATWHFYQRAID
ncbi:MAG: DUF2189 domain-containing protein [Pseudomonadota bacterium]